MYSIGTHYLWDVKGVDHDNLSFVDKVKPVLQQMIATTDLTILSESFKQFDPVGVTGILLLSESHFSIHTWPEHGYAGLDLFSCIPIDHEVITRMISDLWGTSDISLRILARGAGAGVLDLPDEMENRD